MTVKTFEFSDLDSGSKAIVIVRGIEVGIGLAISIEEDGDVEVVLSKELASQIGHLLIDFAAGERPPSS